MSHAGAPCANTGKEHAWEPHVVPSSLVCSDCGETKLAPGARPTWPETWMSVAREIARRSYDPRLKVGAIIVPEDNTGILALGYNGSWRGGPHEPESMEPGKSGMIHAEENALIKAPYHYPLRKHMYVTNSPCRQCAKLCINAGIVRVVYEHEYRDASPLDIMRSAGVEVLQLVSAILLAHAKQRP